MKELIITIQRRGFLGETSFVTVVADGALAEVNLDFTSEDVSSQGRAFFAITLKIPRIPTEHVRPKDSTDFKLTTEAIYSIETLSYLEIIAKTSFSIMTKMLNPGFERERSVEEVERW